MYEICRRERYDASAISCSRGWENPFNLSFLTSYKFRGCNIVVVGIVKYDTLTNPDYDSLREVSE